MNGAGGGRPGANAAKELWRLATRHRLLLIAGPLITLAAAIVFAMIVSPVYQSTATLRIDRQQSGIAVLEALKELSGGSEIQTEMAELKSRSLAEDVADALDLRVVLLAPRKVQRSHVIAAVEAGRDTVKGRFKLTRGADATFTITGPKGQQLGTASIGVPVQLGTASITLAPGAAEYDEIAIELQSFPVAVRKLSRTTAVSRPDREANILELSYAGTDRQLVTAVLNEMATRFIQRRDNVRKTQARSTMSFIGEQIAALGTQLRVNEENLRRFQESHRVVDPETQGEAQVTRLAQYQAERDVLDAERRSLARIFAEIEAEPVSDDAPSPYRRLFGFPTLLKEGPVSELLRLLSEMENQRGMLLVRRLENDDEVLAFTRRIRQIEDQLEDLVGTYLQTLTDQVASLDRMLAGFESELNRIPANALQLARLQREAKVAEDIYTELQTRLKEAEIVAAVEDPSVRVIDPAVPPLKPIRPNIPLNLTLAVLLGLALGAGAAFFRETLDTTIHTRDELQALNGAVPVLGMIPKIDAVGESVRPQRFPLPIRAVAVDHRPATLVAHREPGSAVSEAYRTLRTNVAFSRPDQPPRTLVITSALPGDGKSTSSANLAVTLAQQGRNVVLIDADMRRGELHRLFGVAGEPGLSNVLLGYSTLAEAMHEVDIDGVRLRVIPTGAYPPTPAELLGSARMSSLLEDLAATHDAVIIDTPPLNAVTDAAIAGSKADGVVIVTRAGVTDRDAYLYALDQLNAVRARVLGTVLNGVDAKLDRRYGVYAAAGYYTRS